MFYHRQAGLGNKKKTRMGEVIMEIFYDEDTKRVKNFVFIVALCLVRLINGNI